MVFNLIHIAIFLSIICVAFVNGSKRCISYMYDTSYILLIFFMFIDDIFYVPAPPSIHVTSVGGMFPTSLQLITYSLKRCRGFNLLNIMSCTLQVFQRYKEYSQQHFHITNQHTWLTATDRICGTFLFYLSHAHPSHSQMNQVHKVQLTIFAVRNHNFYVTFLEMTFAYSTDCFEQGVFVVSQRSKAILSQFCAEYDTFDMIYPVETLNIQVHCILWCSIPHLRIRYQPTYRLPFVPLNRMMTADKYRLLYERGRVKNGVMLWVRVTFHNIIHLVKRIMNENVTIFDGPSVNCKELTGLLSSSFQIVMKLIVHDITVNISYKTTAAPQHIRFSDIYVNTETRSTYRVYDIPSGFELKHVAITGVSGEACNLGGVVLLQYDGDDNWEEIGPYCGTSFWNISVQNIFMSIVVIYSYGATNISLHMSTLTNNNERILIHMGLRNSFIAGVDGYHFGETIEMLTVLPKPWSNGNSDTVSMSLYFPYRFNIGLENEHRGISERRLITISTHPNAVKFLREVNCDWWIHTSELYGDIKGYLSEYLRLGIFETITYNALIKWNQGCSVFPYAFTIEFTNMENKMTYVYREPLEPFSVFLFTNNEKPITLLFPDLRISEIHYIRVAAHCRLAQIWEVMANNCTSTRIAFGKYEGRLKSVTLNASEPQRLPSGYSHVSLLRVWRDPHIGGNSTQASCSLTLHATSYLRLLFHTELNAHTVSRFNIKNYKMNNMHAMDSKPCQADISYSACRSLFF